jgi:hypothetical protein
MLADYQQALADLTGSPELCVRVREDPALVHERYGLTDREWRRLVAIVQHRGMECACMLYRANRLAPLVLTLPDLCRALGADLRAVASDYWAAFPETNVHVFVEADRFCGFLRRQLAEGRALPAGVAAALDKEGGRVAAQLLGSRTEQTEAAAAQSS